ncbi:MAG: translocation/assembly module TamB domain-containing protein [Prochlorotrichaceae cyanobacterium]
MDRPSQNASQSSNPAETSPDEVRMTEAVETAIQPRSRRWIRGLAGVGIVTLIVVAGGALWLRYYLNEKLSPQVAAALSDRLDRPVELGALERYSFSSVRFGATALPATATDPDWAKVEAIEISFNLWQGLRTRHLVFDLTLIAPEAYVEQGENGQWLDIALEREEPGWFKVDPYQIAVERGRIAIVPRNGTGQLEDPLTVEEATGKLRLSDNMTQVALDLKAGVLAEGETGEDLGQVQINVDGALDLSQLAFALRAEQLPLLPLVRLVESQTELPSYLVQGTLQGNLQGSVVGRELADVSGTLDLAAVSIQVPGIPLPITEGAATVNIEDDRYDLRDVVATWGVAQGSLNGAVVLNRADWQQSQVEAEVALTPFALPELLQPFGVAVNLPVRGTWQTKSGISGTLEDLAIAGRVENEGPVSLEVPNAEPSTSSRLPLDTFSSRFQAEINPFALAQGLRPPVNLFLSEIRAVPQAGGLVAGGGLVTLPLQELSRSSLDLDLSLEALPADTLADQLGRPLPLQVGTIAAQTNITGTIADPQALVNLQALGAEFPTRARAQISTQGWTLEEALVTTAGGPLQVRGTQPAGDDRWSLQVRTAALNFQALKIPVPGDLAGVVNLSGPRNQFATEQIRAEGDLRFSEGIAVIKDPIQASFGWDGSQVIVQKATAQGFTGRGTVQVNLTNLRSPQITDLGLLVQLSNYDLKKLPVRFPQPVNVEAGVNFQGRVTGAVDAPWVQGNVEVLDLTVNRKPFEPSLTGPFRLNPEGVALRVRGERDLLETRLDPDYLPRTASVIWNGGVAQVDRQDTDRFAVTLNGLPVAALGLELPAPQIGQQPLLGTASGSATVSVKPDFTMAGNLTVTQPALGHLKGQQLNTDFRLVNGNLTVQEGRLQVGSSQFDFDGRAIVNAADPSYQLAIAVNQGQVGDFLQVFRWFDLIDLRRGLQEPEYNTAADLLLPNVGLPEAPLRLQLYRFSEVKSQVTEAIRRQQASQNLPPLTDLVGDFAGQISVNGTLNTGINAEFRFAGEEWQWGTDYRANQVEVAGEFKDKRLTLQPVHLTLNDTTEVNFQGILGQNPQFGTLSVTELPLALVRDFVDLPLDLRGNLNLEANLSGSVEDPQLVGELNLVEGSLNGAALQTEKTGFNYSDRRLSFGGTLLVATGGDEAVQVSGEFPAFTTFALAPLLPPAGATVLTGQDFSPLRRGDLLSGAGQEAIVAAVAEDGSSVTLDRGLTCSRPCTLSVIPRLRLNLDVANEGIKVLNLLTQDKLTWREGEGRVNLALGGTIRNPQASGSAAFSNATIAAQFIPADEAITDLSGQINFDTDRIIVEQLNGRFSSGEVTAQGAIGLDRPLPPEIVPLEVSFRNLILNIPGKYRGGAAGDVQILGTVLSPRLTGSIEANNGNVILPDPSSAVAARVFGEPSAARQTLQSIGFTPITLENLNLSLGDDITIASEPLFNFKATGDLLINGGFEDLRPDGTINLTRGQVNLFTTNFLLARRANNTAIFRPQTGLDPDLDIEMVASVTEVSRRNPTAGPLTSSEISDTRNSNGFGELQTVRISATVDGPASEILQSLSLSSRPARTQGELYALMGGGFVNTLGQGGDSTLALANLAGSALLNNLQAALNSVLRGPVDFRLFPLVVESQDRKDQSDSNQDSQDPGAETLALGAEVGVNLTNSVSFSMLRLLTLDIPTRFNVNYQINNNFQLRATTDFQDENRVVLEYEARF